MKVLIPYTQEALVYAHTKRPIFNVFEPETMTTILEDVTLDEALEFIRKGKNFQYRVDIANEVSVTYALGKFLRYDSMEYTLKQVREEGFIYD